MMLVPAMSVTSRTVGYLSASAPHCDEIGLIVGFDRSAGWTSSRRTRDSVKKDYRWPFFDQYYL